jgi:hypothetical protein
MALGHVFAFDVAGDRIKHIWVVRNPEKLRPWTTDGSRHDRAPAAARYVTCYVVVDGLRRQARGRP